MFRNTSRCITLLLMMVAMAFAFGSTAYAQLDPEHGGGITKACGAPVRTCDNDVDCADTDECTDNVCNKTNTRVTSNCTFTVTNTDGFNDTLSITNAHDVISNFGGPTTVTAANITINAVAGGTTCASANTALPCIIPVGGQLQFRSNFYQPTMQDFALNALHRLPDTAQVTYFDLCDGTVDASCNDVDPNLLQASAQQQLETGCGSTPTDCDDGSLCTADSCDPATGCANAPADCDDGDACTDDSCDQATGRCVNTPNIDCDDGDACTDDSCDPATGTCVNTPNFDCDDGDACTDDSCNPATGLCEHGASPSCDDQDECTDDSCDPATGACVNTDNGQCGGEDICRTPGFWGTHGGVEKKTSQNITQAVITKAGGALYVCGTTIANTLVNNTHSAVEAMCIPVKGAPRLQLARQLTGAALNCALTLNGGLGDCTGVESIADLYDVCNAACASNSSAAKALYAGCIEDIDAWNNGLTGNLCHDRDLCPDFSDDGILNGSAACYEPTGAAGSSTACNAAIKSPTTVVTP